MYDRPRNDEDLSAHQLRLRNQERVELIMSFYRGLKVFRDLSHNSSDVSHRFRFDEMDRLIEEHLRLVKDGCHRLFRESRREDADRFLQAVFDMYFGIVFHILLKAKENLRLQENYNIERLEDLMAGLREARRMSGFPPGVGPLFESLTGEFERDTEELHGEMERARFMFNELEKIFNHIIQAYDQNATIVRSLYCQKDFFSELFPREGIDRIFARIYPKNGPVEAYFIIGFDYLRSGHMPQAQEAFAEALKAARRRRMPQKQLRRLYDTYRERLLSETRSADDLALAVQLRLRDIEGRPPLRTCLANATRRDVAASKRPADGKTAAAARLRPAQSGEVYR